MDTNNNKILSVLDEERWKEIRKGIADHLTFMRKRAGFKNQKEFTDHETGITSYD